LSSSATLTGTEVVTTFGEIGFPGNLNNCLNCHSPGDYNFENGLAQVPFRLHRTVAAGTMAAADKVGSLSLSPYVAAGATYGSGHNSTSSQPTGDTLVNSPIANACFGCHDGQTSADPSLSVKAHIESNGGGSIYRTRASALLKVQNSEGESCLLCYGPTQVVPIKAAHGL
jgi:OmcA/MtrC family decaheme c-type cytochrome